MMPSLPPPQCWFRMQRVRKKYVLCEILLDFQNKASTHHIFVMTYDCWTVIDVKQSGVGQVQTQKQPNCQIKRQLGTFLQNHRLVKTERCCNSGFRLDFSIPFVSQHCAYAQFRFRHKNYMVGVKETSWFKEPVQVSRVTEGGGFQLPVTNNHFWSPLSLLEMSAAQLKKSPKSPEVNVGL